MRLVAFSDSHLFHGDLQIPDGDVLIVAGNLLQAGGIDELTNAAEWLRSLPHRHKVLVAGNHDWCFQRQRDAALALLPDVTYLEDSGTEIDQVRFWGSPWQPAYNNWAFNLERGAPLRQKWALIPESTDILVTHAAPEGIGDHSPEGRSGCEELRERVSQLMPPLHLFGHIHEGGGFWEIDGVAYCNVTTWECMRGVTVLDYHRESGVVTPVTVPPAKPE